jgi:hypothetical protein
MRERDRDFEVTYRTSKGTTDRPTAVDAGDLLSTTASTKNAAFFGWQVGAIPVGQVDITDRSAPIDVAGVMRLVKGASFGQGQRQIRLRTAKGGRQQEHQQ